MAGSGSTVRMSVDDITFMLHRLSQDCAPKQEYRELSENAIEAVVRALANGDKAGNIVWEVDWQFLQAYKAWKLCVIDDGDGMTGDDQKKYINHLSSSSSKQSLEGNYGVGAKISAGARNPYGLVYQSWRDGAGSMIRFWSDPDTGEYGLERQEFPSGSGSYRVDVPLDSESKIAPIKKHGTRVTLLGKAEKENTVRPGNESTHWLVRYLNTRYFELPPGVTLKVREFESSDPSTWPTQPQGNGTQLRTVHGMKRFLDQFKIDSGTVPLTGAIAHWWLLPDKFEAQTGKERSMAQHTQIWQSTGHVAAMYRAKASGSVELLEMQTGSTGRRMLQHFGVVFGPSRVAIYVEPLNGERQVTTNTARTQMIVDRNPLPWDTYAEEFRNQMPKAIQEMMDSIISGSKAGRDHRDAILRRLKELRDMLKLSRYRPTADGSQLAEGDASGGVAGRGASRSGGGGGGSSGGGRRGNLYKAYVSATGTQSEQVNAKNPEPDVKWVSVRDNTREKGDFEDRAARYIPEQNVILVNADFRVYVDLIKHFTERYPSVSGIEETVTQTVQEWFSQQLMEAVLGVRALEGSPEWDEDAIGRSWSEEALTAAVMPRYNVYAQIKRALGGALGSTKSV